jgi:hypothetical protein
MSGGALRPYAALNGLLKANPDYADAVFNLALLLQRLERIGGGRAVEALS